MKKTTITTKSIEEIRAEAAALEAAFEAEYLASLTSETVAAVEGDEDAVDALEAQAMQDEDGHTRDLSAISFFRDFQ